MRNKSSKVLQRGDVDNKYKWNLDSIYPSELSWQNDFDKVKNLVSTFKQYKHTLSNSASALLNCLHAYDELFSLLDKLFMFSKMKKDEDNSQTFAQEQAEKANSLLTDAITATSFVSTEISNIPEEKINQFVAENNNLKLYQQYFKEMLRQKKHILSHAEEELLGLASDIASSPNEIFEMFNNADIKFPDISNDQGEKTELTQGRYIGFLESQNRTVRKKAFNALLNTYANHKNMLASTLLGNIKSNKFYARARKYDSAREISLDADNVTVDIYDNLIQTVHDNIHLLEKYLRIRKKKLGIKKMNMFDLYVPLVEESNRKIPYEEATEMVLKGLQPLGKEYCSIVKKAFSEGWVDVYENIGKTTGAYSVGSYLTHPFVLLNYQEKLNDVLTLAHEIGHAMHSYYTNITQPYIYSAYKIFVAEVASTLNEALLTDYLLKCASNNMEKAYILNHFLEEFRGTIFRQVMFAEFEKIIHQTSEEGGALSAETLCKIYLDLNQKYYGSVVNVDEEIGMEWARIPHFYNSFYVYKYATGMSSALTLSNAILQNKPAALEKYMNFLKSGCSDYPIELLRKAGVDLSTPQPIIEAFKVFEDKLNEFEKILDTL